MTNDTSQYNPTIVMGILITFAVFALIFLIVILALRWIVYKKAGRPGWHGIIPFYSTYVFFKLGDQSGWWLLVMFIPVINIVGTIFYYIAGFKIGNKFGVKDWYLILLILIPIIWWGLLAFDKSIKWDENRDKINE